MVSGGRQPSHAGKSRKKSFKRLKAEARLTHARTHTRRADYTCARHYTHVHTPAVPLAHPMVPASVCQPSLSGCTVGFQRTLLPLLHVGPPACPRVVGLLLADAAGCDAAGVGTSGTAWWDLVPACVSMGIWSHMCAFPPLASSGRCAWKD